MVSTTFRFVHAADLHLDVPFHGLRRAAPRVTRALSQAPLAAWDALVQLAIDQEAAFLLLAGDICSGAERAVHAQLRLLAGLERLSARGIRTFIVCGDEDPADGWKAIQRWPGGVHCFGSQSVESVAIQTGEYTTTIHGVSHAADRMPSLVDRFQRGSESGIHIGLVHASVGRSRDGASPHHATIEELRAADLHYWALGHDHQHHVPCDGYPWIVYPGTPQGRNLTADETGPKGAVVATVTNGLVVDASFHALDVVRTMTADVDGTMLTGESEMRRALLDIEGRWRREGARPAVVARAILRGRALPWVESPESNGFDRLLEALRQRDLAGDSFVWWDSVLDMTEAHEIPSRNDAAARLRRLVDVLRPEPGSLRRLLADHNLPGAGPGVLAGQPPLDSLEIDELLTQAERVAVNLLERERL
jgi:DNA repair exonuclease SbcCD nuclease subunit